MADAIAIDDRADLKAALAGEDPPYVIQFRQGDRTVTLPIMAINFERGTGSECVELHRGDRYVTVSVTDELDDYRPGARGEGDR